MVGSDGKRFVREDERRDVIRDAILSLPNQTGFSIIDQNSFDETNPGQQKSITEGFKTGDACWPADTIEELAKKMGGIVINAKTQVLDRRGQVIPHLHAVGELTGGIHGTNRLGGNAICDIFTFGRLTGMYVAKGE